MPDLSFTEVQAKLPSGTIVADTTNNDVKISLKALMNESSVAMADEKVGEAIAKFLDACASAQDDYNTSTSNTEDLQSYPAPAAGAPIRNTLGVYESTFAYTVSVNVPLNRDQIQAVIL